MSNGRIPLYDEARGIAILLVVIGHCIGSLHNPMNQAILSFHMPLFFQISLICERPLTLPVVQGEIGVHLLELGVLFFEFLELF